MGCRTHLSTLRGAVVLYEYQSILFGVSVAIFHMLSFLGCHRQRFLDHVIALGKLKLL